MCFIQLGVDATDSDEVRLEKNMVVASFITSASTALVWRVIYYLQGEVPGGSIFLLAMVVGSFFFVNLLRTRNISQFKFVMFLIYLTVPTSVTWFL